MPRSIEFFKQSLGQSVLLLHPRTVPAPTPSLIGNTAFTLKGHTDARVVALAGSFNGWDSQHLLFGDDQWINDPDNPLIEDSVTGA